MKKETLPAVLEKSAQESGLELSKAQAIAVNYVPFMELAQTEAEKLKGLEIGNPEHVETAKRIRLDLGKICSQLKDQKDNDKAIIKIEDRYIMGLFNSVEGFARLTQKDAEEIEKHAEKLAAEASAQLKADRCEMLAPYQVDGSMLNVELMVPEVWENYLNGVKLNHQAKKEAEAKEKAEAEAAEKARKEFYDRRLQLTAFDQYGAKYSLSPETTAEQFAEILEQCEATKEHVIEAVEKENAAAELRRKEANETFRKAAEEIARLKKEREDQAAEDAKKLAKLNAETEKAKDEAEVLRKNEADRIAKELAEAKRIANAELKAARAPDIKKAIAAVEACQFEAPEVESVEINEKLLEINNKFQLFKVWATDTLKA